MEVVPPALVGSISGATSSSTSSGGSQRYLVQYKNHDVVKGGIRTISNDRKNDIIHHGGVSAIEDYYEKSFGTSHTKLTNHDNSPPNDAEEDEEEQGVPQPKKKLQRQRPSSFSSFFGQRRRQQKQKQQEGEGEEEQAAQSVQSNSSAPPTTTTTTTTTTMTRGGGGLHLNENRRYHHELVTNPKTGQQQVRIVIRRDTDREVPSTIQDRRYPEPYFDEDDDDTGYRGARLSNPSLMMQQQKHASAYSPNRQQQLPTWEEDPAHSGHGFVPPERTFSSGSYPPYHHQQQQQLQQNRPVSDSGGPRGLLRYFMPQHRQWSMLRKEQQQQQHRQQQGMIQPGAYAIDGTGSVNSDESQQDNDEYDDDHNLHHNDDDDDDDDDRTRVVRRNSDGSAETCVVSNHSRRDLRHQNYYRGETAAALAGHPGMAQFNAEMAKLDHLRRKRKKRLCCIGVGSVMLLLLIVIVVLTTVLMVSNNNNGKSSTNENSGSAPDTRDGTTDEDSASLAPTLTPPPWLLEGQPIQRQAMDSFAQSVSLSSDGSVLAVSSHNATYVYGFSSFVNAWSQLGQTLTGHDAQISSDGSLVAVQWLNRVSVYQRSRTTSTSHWSQLGQDMMLVEGIGLQSFAMASHLPVIALGGRDAGTHGRRTHVQVFHYNAVNQQFQKIGKLIDQLDGHRVRVALSMDGSILVTSTDYLFRSDETLLHTLEGGQWRSDNNELTSTSEFAPHVAVGDNVVVMGLSLGRVVLYDSNVARGKGGTVLTLNDPTDQTPRVSISADGLTVAALWESRVRVWVCVDDESSRQSQRQSSTERKVRWVSRGSWMDPVDNPLDSVALSGDGNHIAVGIQNTSLVGVFRLDAA